MTTGQQLVDDFVRTCFGVPYHLGAEWVDLSRRPARLDCSESIEGICKRNGIYMVDGSANQEAYCRAKGTYRGGPAGVEWARRIPGALLFRRAGTAGLAVGHVVMVRTPNSTCEARSSKYGTGSWPIAGRPFTGGALIPGVNYVQPAPPAQPVPPAPAPLPRRPTLKLGDSGHCVLVGQYELRVVTGAEIPVTGTFDQFTLAKTVDLQKFLHLPVTGQLDTLTWNALDLVFISKGHTPGPC